MKWISNNGVYKKFKSNEFKNKMINKLSQSQLNKIFNSIGENVEVWEINSLITKQPNQFQKILFLKYTLLSGKQQNLKIVNDFFISVFSRKIPLIIIANYLKQFSVTFDAAPLDNNKIKFILKKYSYSTDFYNIDYIDDFFDWNDVSKNSIFDMFDEMCRRIIYKEKMENKFSVLITWEIIEKKLKINKLEKERNILIKKINKANNHLQAIELINKKNKIDEDIKNTIKELKSQNIQ